MESTVATFELTDTTLESGSWRDESARLLWQALPNVGTSVLRMMMTFVDFTMCSRLGTEAQAAVSPASLFCFIIVAGGMAVASTVTTFASQAIGRRDPHEA